MDNDTIPNWDDMRFLLALSRHKSTLNAARELNVSHQTISRRLTTFEKDVGTRLIDRSSKPWTLTHVGEKLVTQAEEMEKCIMRSAQISRSEHQEMSGRVNITSVELGLEFIILPCIKQILKSYPKLQFEVKSNLLSDNISSGAFDIALRFTNSPPEHLIGRKVGTIEFSFYGAKEMIEEFDKSLLAEEEVSTPMINLTAPHPSTRNLANKYLKTGTIVHAVNDLPALKSAVKLGLGVGLLPKTIVGKEDNLFESSIPQPDKNLDVWILRNLDSRNSTKIKKIEAYLSEYASNILNAND